MSLGRYSGRTDVGRKRRHNEDSYIVAPPLFAVADGMGGANAGEVASGIAVETLKGGDGDFVSLIEEANRRVFKRSSDDAAASGMGTTMIAAVVSDEKVRFANVGDSRAYLFRDGELKQVTEDHSLVGELVRSGKLSPEDAKTHPQRSVITRALGTDADVDVDTYDVETRSGDLFLLCSDGLYSMVGHKRLAELVDRHRGDLEQLTKALIIAANRGGGDDNITAVVFEIAAAGEETVRLPTARPADEVEEEPELEEADTLDERDAVPRVSTMVIRAEDIAALADQGAPAEAAPAPAEEPDFEPAAEAARGGRLLLLLVLAAIVVAVVVVLLFVFGVF